MKNIPTKIEIMSPAGSFESLRAAVSAGADSVYFGVGKLNMRARAAMNFKLSDLPKIIKFCKANKVKTYLTVNTLIYDEDLKTAQKLCQAAKKYGVDAIIASDLAVITYANSIGVKVHISTQANVSNFEAVKFFAKYSEVIVLARELNIEQIKKIVARSRREKILGSGKQPIRFELFVHGALCVAIAGKCHMSLALYNHSANRGDCLQVCRRSFNVKDDSTEQDLVIDNKYVMSPKDLSTIAGLDKIIQSGVSVLKIEGRGRSADYVYTVTKVYKEAVESIQNKTYNKEKIQQWTEQLKTVFNRGFWEGGYYLGKKTGEWSGAYGSQATEQKVFIGLATKYFPKAKVAEFKISTGTIKNGDEVMIIGPKIGYLRKKIDGLRANGQPAKTATKGDDATFVLDQKIFKSDKLYLIKPR